jgi:hypothetical protein
VWLGAVFVLENRHALGRNDLGNRIVRIPQVRDPAGIEGTGLDAGGVHALRNPVVTEVAFFRDLVDRVEEAHAVGAGHDAVATADAPFPVDQDDTVASLVSRTDGAHLHARGVVALVAELRHEEGLGDVLRIDFFAIDDIIDESVAPTVRRVDMGLAVLRDYVAFDPRPGNRCIVRNLVLVLARFDAEAATHAFTRIDEESPADVRVFDRRPGFFVRQECKSTDRQHARQCPAAGLLQEVSS